MVKKIDIQIKLNDFGYVSSLCVNNDEIFFNDLCNNVQDENNGYFILYITKLLRDMGFSEKEHESDIPNEYMAIFQREIARFGITQPLNVKELVEFSKKIDLNFSYFVLQWSDYVKKSIGFPYDKNFLFLSEIIEYVFDMIKQNMQDYTLKIKENNNFFTIINTKDFRNIRNNRKLKIALQKYSLNFKHRDIIYIPNDVLVSISFEEIKSIKTDKLFSYMNKPNFLINLFKSIDIDTPEIIDFFSNYGIPLFFTDIFDIIIKKEKNNA